mgnify:CR=1 FL=1
MNYSFKTISKKVMGDLHTPVSIYLKVRDIYPESALLESSDFHGNENSLSFIALRPLASIGINNGECTATFPDETYLMPQNKAKCEPEPHPGNTAHRRL